MLYKNGSKNTNTAYIVHCIECNSIKHFHDTRNDFFFFFASSILMWLFRESRIQEKRFNVLALYGYLLNLVLVASFRHALLCGHMEVPSNMRRDPGTSAVCLVAKCMDQTYSSKRSIYLQSCHGLLSSETWGGIGHHCRVIQTNLL